MRFEQLADDIVALLDHLGLPEADLFGYSVGAGVALQVAIRHPARVRRVAAASATYRTDGLHAEITGGDGADSGQLRDSLYHRAYQAVAPDPQHWPTLVAKVFDLDAQPQDWPAEQVAAITAPTMLIVADNDIVRLEHAVEMIHLLDLAAARRVPDRCAGMLLLTFVTQRATGVAGLLPVRARRPSGRDRSAGWGASFGRDDAGREMTCSRAPRSGKPSAGRPGVPAPRAPPGGRIP